MEHTIKYVLDTENYALKIKPNKQNGVFTLGRVSDSEFGGEKDTRISFYGYLLFFCGGLIAWKSKAGKSATLSSTEAEYLLRRNWLKGYTENYWRWLQNPDVRGPEVNHACPEENQALKLVRNLKNQ
jgi:hypothetical protein